MRYPASLPPLAVAAALLMTGTVAVHAQPAPAQQQDEHGAHHPDAGQTATPAPAQPPQHGGMGMMGPQGGPPGGGMMGSDMMNGGDMGRMMPMMLGGMMGGMPFEHIEGRLAFLKTELKITPAQEPQWSTFADTVRSIARSMKDMHEQMMQGGGRGGMMRGGAQAASAPARLDHYERMLTTRLEVVRTIKAAFAPLYASLSDEQKKTADELMSGPMGVM